MVNAICLIKANRRSINSVAEKLAAVEDISEVYSVAGKYDLVAIIRAPSNEKLADIVTNHMLKIEGIIETETMIAFQCFSRHDLESMFSIGFKEKKQ
ncbi:MAG: Lrp/AsnC family transcriptional regulator [Chitinivibrionales bacterium]|nr:Lrp/AsnC family transcriptional regulator [Chitinivibrionales bacterium]